MTIEGEGSARVVPCRLGLARGSDERQTPQGRSVLGAKVSGTNITLLCQSRTVVGIVPGLSRPGDSGSPVFYWGGGSNVTLTGILWGGNSSNTSFVFRPMPGIEGELGALRTFCPIRRLRFPIMPTGAQPRAPVATRQNAPADYQR